MNRLSIAALALLTGLSMGIGACTPANKVKKTFALNDLQIKAGVAEDRGDWEQAYELWGEYVNRRPQSAMAEHRLGLVELQLGLNEQAITHLRVAYDLQPDNLEYLEALADALLLVRDRDQLLALLQQSAENSDDGNAHLRLASYAQRAGMMDEARDALTIAIVSFRGESPVPYRAMADFAQRVGDTDLEINNLRQALWFNPSDAAINTRLSALGMIPGPSLALPPEF